MTCHDHLGEPSLVRSTLTLPKLAKLTSIKVALTGDAHIRSSVMQALPRRLRKQFQRTAIEGVVVRRRPGDVRWSGSPSSGVEEKVKVAVLGRGRRSRVKELRGACDREGRRSDKAGEVRESVAESSFRVSFSSDRTKHLRGDISSPDPSLRCEQPTASNVSPILRMLEDTVSSRLVRAVAPLRLGMTSQSIPNLVHLWKGEGQREDLRDGGHAGPGKEGSPG